MTIEEIINSEIKNANKKGEVIVFIDLSIKLASDYALVFNKYEIPYYPNYNFEDNEYRVKTVPKVRF